MTAKLSMMCLLIYFNFYSHYSVTAFRYFIGNLPGEHECHNIAVINHIIQFIDQDRITYALIKREV